jgi:bifunctional non-homologous end joining protein LigD
MIAAGEHGEPNFLALLHARKAPLCVYAFDFLELQGRDTRNEPLEQRRARLRGLLSQAKGNLLRFSDRPRRLVSGVRAGPGFSLWEAYLSRWHCR